MTQPYSQQGGAHVESRVNCDDKIGQDLLVRTCSRTHTPSLGGATDSLRWRLAASGRCATASAHSSTAGGRFPRSTPAHRRPVRPRRALLACRGCGHTGQLVINLCEQDS